VRATATTPLCPLRSWVPRCKKRERQFIAEQGHWLALPATGIASSKRPKEAPHTYSGLLVSIAWYYYCRVRTCSRKVSRR
jgi:hypothetical protein